MPEYEDVYEAPMLDGTGQDVAAAIRELKGVVQPTNVCIDLDVSLEVSGWSNSAPYIYNWMNNKVTTECAVKVNYLEGAEDTDDLYIGYEKIVGGIQFESPTKPTAAIPVRIHIVNAEADSITNIDDEMVSSDVISGASNVKQALTSLKNADTTLSEQIGTLDSKVVAISRHTRKTDFSLSDLQAAVAEQNLAKYGLKPGDQKTINGHTYVIAGLNTMKGSHAYTCTNNHVGLIVIPHTTCKWNASGNTYTGADGRGAGYKNCDLQYYLANDVMQMVNTDLGSGHVYQHKKLFGNAINQSGYNRFGMNSGCTSGWEWVDAYISALTEAQVFGGDHWSSSGYDTGEANTLLPVFAEYKHTEIFGNEYLWLRNVSSASQACYANRNGDADGARGVGNASSVAGLILYH